MEAKREVRNFRIFYEGQEDLMNLEEWLAYRQIKKSMFAKLVGVHPVTVSRWISGARQPACEQLGAICHVLDCKPFEIAWKEPLSTTTTAADSGKRGNILTNWLKSVKEFAKEVG
ncbi:TPA: helix-turn-helix transcriptional regulator [Streptococcus suis]|nr:helix-turn-helix transcriptional regulator [Streptococcus suis]